MGDDLWLKYALDADGWKIHSSVSKGRTLRCGVRYTRKKLPVAFLMRAMFFLGPESLRQLRPIVQWCILLSDS